MFQPVHGEAATIAFQHLQMREHAVGQVAVEARRGHGDLRPVLLRAFGHRLELRAVAGMFGHGQAPR
jgi:hypothetical protein